MKNEELEAIENLKEAGAISKQTAENIKSALNLINKNRRFFYCRNKIIIMTLFIPQFLALSAWSPWTWLTVWGIAMAIVCFVGVIVVSSYLES